MDDKPQPEPLGIPLFDRLDKVEGRLRTRVETCETLFSVSGSMGQESVRCSDLPIDEKCSYCIGDLALLDGTPEPTLKKKPVPGVGQVGGF